MNDQFETQTLTESTLGASVTIRELPVGDTMQIMDDVRAEGRNLPLAIFAACATIDGRTYTYEELQAKGSRIFGALLRGGMAAIRLNGIDNDAIKGDAEKKG